MKRIYAIMINALWVGLSFAQGTLPMFTNMDEATIPTGFTASLGATGNKVYTLAAYVKSSPNAMRIDATGEYLTAYWSGKADTMTYWLSGTAASGITAWQGTVTIDESVDGSNWTNVRTHTDDLGVQIKEYMVRLNSGSRYMRILFKNKITGFNAAIDDVTIRPAGSGVNPELKVFYNGNEQIHKKTLKAGNDTLVKLQLKNNSKMQDLLISSAQLSGTDFEVQNTLPLTLKPSESLDLLVHMKSDVPGTHNSLLKLATNDPEMDTFELSISTIKGTLASEPKFAPTGLNVTAKAFRMNGSFSSSDAESYLVLMAISDTTALPQDGKMYQRGEYIGKSKVVYSGPVSSAIDFDGIIANTNYHVAVFGFNGYDEFTNYLTSNKAVGVFTTPGLNAQSYYAGIDPLDTQFLIKLQNKVRPHRKIFYSNYASYVVNNFEARDTADNKQVLNCFYSGYPYVYTPPFNHTVMSREHCYPYSYMTEGNQDSSNYMDLHILRTVHQTEVNAVRSNYPLNNVKTVISKFWGGTYGKDSSGNFCYEPRNEVKGEVARANFYACATYNTEAKPFTIPTSNQAINELQDQYVLKRWNTQFPPTNWEIARHEYVAQSSVQNNRNPFIDHPDWACYIDFATMTYNKSGLCEPPKTNSNKLVSKEVAIQVYPNPSKSDFNVDLSGFSGDEVTIHVVDFFERTVFEKKTNDKDISINGSNWSSGNYLLLIRTSDGRTAATQISKN